MSCVPANVRDLCEARVRSLSSALAEALTVTLPVDLPWRASFVVTGVGASEGPARYLALLLGLAGRRAVFTPLSSFLVAQPAALGEVLVVFSHGLSPNARIALRRAGEHGMTVLFTGLDPDHAAPDVAPLFVELAMARGRVAIIPPKEEGGTLVRFVSPATGMLAGARFAARLGAPIDVAHLARLPGLAATAPERAAALVAGLPEDTLHRRVAIVGAGPWLEGTQSIANKWLEGLGAREPPRWDVLQIAHGPYQQFFDEEMTLLALEHEQIPEERALFDRLESMLVEPRHAMLRIRTTLPPPLGLLDHDLVTSALLLRALDERSKDIGAGIGPDAPLYGLGRERGR